VLNGILRGAKAAVIIAMGLGLLAGCGGSQKTDASQAANPETVLRNNTAALQKTILEGAIAGAGSGSGIGFLLGGQEGARRGGQLGSLVGATAGSYVAFIQRRYILRETRLNEVLEDLQANNALLTATLVAMQAVVAKNRGELEAAKAQPPVVLARETAETQANLAQMQTAIARAQSRQAEFQPVRSLNLVGSDGRSPDPQLQILADRIAQMQAVAAELQGLL